MTDWTAGYVADIDYTYGYYENLNPSWARLAFLKAGLSCPEFGTACELGFGQGLSVNIHSAASTTRWYGNDFNPNQAAFARELAEVSGAGAKLYDDAFAEFANRADLPEFDYIGMHGIWSWINDENRAVIVDFIKRKLKLGGVLYISYNTLPGWAAFAPLRHLMTQHTEVIGSVGEGIASRINGAVDFAEKLLATNPFYYQANPQIDARIKELRAQNHHCLAHEYFNRDWHPMHFSTMAKWLEPAKLQYACSAHYQEHVDSINLSAEQQAFLEDISDVMFRESTRDFMVDQQFRKDYWVKGALTLKPLEQHESLYAQKVLLTAHRPDVSLVVSGALGEARMNGAIYNPILDLMADYQPRTLGQIHQIVKDQGISFGQLVEAAMILAGVGQLCTVQDDPTIAKAKVHTEKLNAHLLRKARSRADCAYLASPVTGGGVAVGRFEQLMLLAMQQNQKQPGECARFVWDIVSPQGQRLFKDGKILETAEENIAVLTEQAARFIKNGLPMLKAMQIVA